MSFSLPASIATDRLLLRPPGPGDAAALTAAVAESRARLDPWMPWSSYYDDPIAASVYIATAREQWAHGHELSFLIFDRGSGELLGAIGLHDIHWDRRSFATGYWIRTSAEGQGFVREALRAMARLVFAHLDGTRLLLTCDRRNDRSRHVAESTGMQLEACCRNDARATDGSLRDTLVFGMLASDFERLLPTWPAETFDLLPGQTAISPQSAGRYDDEEELLSDPVLTAQFPNPRVIETPRLRLRVVDMRDAPAFFTLVERSRPDFEAWLPWSRGVRTFADAEALCQKRIAQWSRHGNTDLFAFDRETDALVGSGMLLAFRPEIPSVEIGWWLDSAQTGKGLATEIGGALLRFSMDVWRVNRADVWCQAENLASRAVAARIGFIEEGILRADYPDVAGNPANWAISSVIPDDYRRLAPALPAIRFETNE